MTQEGWCHMTLVLDVNVAINISIIFTLLIAVAVCKNSSTHDKNIKKSNKRTKDKTAKGKKSTKRRKPTKDKNKRK